jgi:hypothetical protein
MSNLKWNPKDYPLDQQIWTDKDLAKFAIIAFVVGFVLGALIWMW